MHEYEIFNIYLQFAQGANSIETRRQQLIRRELDGGCEVEN